MEFSWTTDSNEDGSLLNGNFSLSPGKARQRELERRRARGEASCAECRRLKVKCDRKVPCSSCVRRGCYSICPNGLLATGQGSRLVLADSGTLYNKLLEMSQRIRQLEDALQICQSTMSTSPHPLLAEHLLSIKSGVDVLVKDSAEKESDGSEDEETIVKAMGTLAVTESGATRYVGRVGVETLLMGTAIDDFAELTHATEPGPDIRLHLPEPLIRASQGFPFSGANLPVAQLTDLIRQHLPSYERATALAEAYLGNASWFPRPLKREQIMEDLIPFVYNRKRNKCSTSNGSDKYDGIHCMHYLSLALAVFACGAGTDYTQPLYSRESRIYYDLALAALNTYPILGQGGVTLETVQAIFLIGIYDFVTARFSTVESSTKTLSFAMINAASIGLHRDSAHWDMEPRYVNRRRHAFWEIFSFDKWMSLGTGRPPIFHLQEIDCEYPEDEDVRVDSEGKSQEGPDRWKYRFAKEVIGPLAEHLVLTRPVKYSEMLEFDRKIRDFGDTRLPLDFGPIALANAGLWAVQRDMALLSIHRNFFARAVAKRSVNPLLSPFAPSYLAGYVCSVKLLRKIRESFDLCPSSVVRLWPVWTQSLIAGVIVGSFSLRTDQASWASGAFHELDAAVKLLQEASGHPVAKQGLPILLRLRAKAEVYLQNLTRGTIPKPDCTEFDELELLRDSARLVRRARSEGDVHKPERSDGYFNPATAMAVHPMQPNGAEYAHFGVGAPITVEPATLPNPTLPPIVAESSAIDRDIASILDTVYNGSPSPAVQTPPSQFTTAPYSYEGTSAAGPTPYFQNYAPEHFSSDSSSGVPKLLSNRELLQFPYSVDIQQPHSQFEASAPGPVRESRNNMPMPVEDLSSFANIEDFFRQRM